MLPTVRVVAVLFAVGLAPLCADVVGIVVEQHSGTPVAFAGVRIYKKGAVRMAVDLETDSQGRFEAPGLPEADYRIEVSKANYQSATLRTTGGVPIHVRLARSGVISGKVTDQEGKGLAGSVVYAMVNRAGKFERLPDVKQGMFAVVTQDGAYRLYNLPPRTYAVAATYGASTMSVGSTGHAPESAASGSGVVFYPSNVRPQMFTISSGEEFRGIDLAVSPGPVFAVTGTVAAGKGKGVWIALTPVDQPSFAIANTQLEHDGAFRLEGIPQGTYRLFATAPVLGRSGMGAHLGPDPVYARTDVIVGGRDVEGLSLGLRPGRSAELVLENEGCPATARLALVPLDDWGAYLNRAVELSAAKTTNVENLAPGRYRVRLTDAGSCFLASDVTFDAATAAHVNVPLVAAGSVVGRLRGSNIGQGWTVALLSDDAKQIVVPDNEAKFGFQGLRPGHYRIAAERPSAASATVEIEVRGGVPIQVDLLVTDQPQEKH